MSQQRKAHMAGDGGCSSTTDAAAFQATYSDFRPVKTRKVAQIILEVPLEHAMEALAVLGGMPNPASEVWVAVARLNTKGGGADQPVRHGDPETDKTPPASEASPTPVRARVSPDKRLAQQAGMCCADPRFWAFLTEIGYVADDEMLAADAVRAFCRVKSRSHILPSTPAGGLWDALYSKYVAWRDAPGEATPARGWTCLVS